MFYDYENDDDKYSFIDGWPNVKQWYYTIGQYKPYGQNGIPVWTSGKDSITNYVALWYRIYYSRFIVTCTIRNTLIIPIILTQAFIVT